MYTEEHPTQPYQIYERSYNATGNVTPSRAHLHPHFALPRSHALTLQIAGKFGEQHCFLRIRRDFTHQDGTLNRFFVSHDQDVGSSMGARRSHLFTDALMPESMMHRDTGHPQALERRQGAPSRLMSKMSEIHEGDSPRRLPQTLRASTLTVDRDHCSRVWRTRKA